MRRLLTGDRADTPVRPARTITAQPMPPTRPPSATAFDSSRPWAVHPQVTLRDEPFGALAYHFGTRRLSFLKSRTLVSVVERLSREPTAAAACRAEGVHGAELATFEAALATLAASGMIRPRDGDGDGDLPAPFEAGG